MRQSILRPLNLFAGICLTAALAMNGCVLVVGGDPVLSMSRADREGDTVSVFPTLVIAFSIPLRDSAVSFTFTPPAAGDYSQSLNAARDTLTIRVSGMLDGNARYALRPSRALTAENGMSLDPGEDSIVFFTYPRESGQNGTAPSADTLRRVVFGELSMPGDTDFYVPADSLSRTFCLTSYSVPCRVQVRDGRGDRYPSDRMGTTAVNDTVHVADTARTPMCILVFTDALEAGLRYRLGGTD